MKTVFPHPTLSEMMHEAVLDAYGRVDPHLGPGPARRNRTAKASPSDGAMAAPAGLTMINPSLPAEDIHAERLIHQARTERRECDRYNSWRS